MRSWVTSITLLLSVATPLNAQRTALEFGAHPFTIQLPNGYGLLAEASPNPSFKFVTFASAWRPDHTLALIEIALVDMAAAPEGPANLAEETLQAVRAHLTEWQQGDSTVQVNGVTARRITWSGSEPRSGDQREVAASVKRGVLIVGTRESIAFVLQAYDVEPHAGSTLPQLERALMSFSLVPRRAR